MFVEYELVEGKPIIHIFKRDGKGNRIHENVNGFRPYFYVLEEDVDKIKSSPLVTEISEQTFPSIFGEQVKKVFTRKPSDVRELRKSLSKSFEGDIPFGNRYMIDNIDALPEEKLKILFLDIEIDDRLGMPSVLEAASEVRGITCYDNFSKKFISFILSPTHESKIEKTKTNSIYFFKNEIDLLNTFIKYFVETDPDIISGWNVKYFDVAYLINRMRKLSLPYISLSPLKHVNDEPRIKGRYIFDLLWGYKRMKGSGLKSYSLNEIAMEELGVGKTELLRGKVWQLWESDINRFIEYNVRDVDLCVKLEEKLKIIEYYYRMVIVIGCQWNDIDSSSKLVDMLLLRLAKKEGVVLPTKKDIDEDYKWEGAVIFKPSVGVYENVALFDVKSMYPSIIFSFNLSPECLTTSDVDSIDLGEVELFIEGKSVKKKLRVSKERGIIPKLFGKLWEERNFWREKLKTLPTDSPEYQIAYAYQYNLKVLANSIYGLLGFVKFRLYTPELGSAVTMFGRTLLQLVREEVKKFDESAEVVYGDTDSCFVAGKEGVDFFKMNEFINESLKKDIKERFGVEGNFNVEYEKRFKTIFFYGAKKRYAGNLVWKSGQECDEIKIVGFESVRSDSSNVAMRIQKEVLEMILRKKSKEEVFSYVRNIIKEIKDNRDTFPYEEIGIPKSITKPFSFYKANAPHVRGAVYANRYLNAGIRPGDKIRMIWLKSTGNYPPTDVLSFAPGMYIPDDFVVDFDRMIESEVLNKVERIFEAFGWDVNSLLSSQEAISKWL